MPIGPAVRMLIVPSLSVLLLLTGCAKPAAVPPKRAAPSVTVAVARQEELTDYTEFVGRTEPFETVEVRSRVSGFLQSVEFEDGQQVTEGQVLFRIEADTYEAAHQQDLAKIAVWEAKHELATAQLERRRPLFEKNVIPKDEYEEAVAAVKETEASVLAAKADAARSALDVKYTVVTAPISGRVDRRLVAVGNLVASGTISGGTLLTRVVNDRPMYAYFDVDEKSFLQYRETHRADARTIREKKLPCQIQLNNETGFPHAGVLDFIDSQIDSGSGSISLRATCPNEDSILVGGAFVRVRVPESNTYQAIVIPERSISTDQGTKLVYVVDADNRVVRKNVLLGKQQGGNRVVRSGIEAGDRVIVRGIQRVRVGEPVVPTEEPGAVTAAP